MPGTFIDTNVLFRMFAITPTRFEQFNSTGTSGSKSLDHAIGIILKLRDGTEKFLTSELALLEACGVASNESRNPEKAVLLLKSALEQEGLSILDVKPLAWPVAFSFTLENIEARDALHLAVALLGQANSLMTSDKQFASAVEALKNKVETEGRIIIRPIIQLMYDITEVEANTLERNVARLLSHLELEKVPA